MFEIRFNNNTIEYSNELRDALISTIDYILGRDDKTLYKLYYTYRNYTSEDLIEAIQELTDDKFELIINTIAGSNITIKQEILNLGE